MKKNYNEKLKQYAVQSALKEAGGRNTKALLALVELDEIVLNEDGTIEGLDIKKLKREVPYLCASLSVCIPALECPPGC